NKDRRRRDLFTQLITNLKDILLIKKPTDTNEENTKLDKASILCQAATFLEQHKDDLTHEIKLVTPTLQSPSSSSSLPNPILDFSWKPSCDIISIDEWLQIAIE
ncbi:unnamed protein product, partial [Adineta steineri]